MNEIKIRGHGSENATIMVVGDSATSEEIESGYALHGWAGRELSILFKRNGLDWNKVWKTLYIKDILSYNGTGKKKRKEAVQEISTKADWDGTLREEIRAIGPNIIVPVGELAFTFLTGQRSLHKFRGSVLPLRQDVQNYFVNRTIRVIPTFGAKDFFDETVKVYTTLDVAKIAKNQTRTDPIPSEGLVWVAHTAQEFRNFLNRFTNPSFCFFDIETRYGIPVCISFCFDGYESVTVPLLDKEIDIANTILIWQMVGKVLASNIPKVNQNIFYDDNILSRFGWIVNNIVGDTSLRAGIIYPELPKNLGFLTSIYTDMPYYKDEGKDIDLSIPDSKKRFYIYCARDSLSCYQIYQKQTEDLKDLGLYEFYEEKIQPLYPIYRSINQTGFLVDDEARQKLRSKYTILLQTILSTFRSLCNDPEMNPRSPKFATFVYEELKYPSRKDRTTGNYTTEEEVLLELMVLHEPLRGDKEVGKKVLELAIAARKVWKVLEYINTHIHPDGRWRASYNLGGTTTGRSSSGKTTDQLLILSEERKIKVDRNTSCGRSLQTISKHGFKVGGEVYGKDLRSIFVPTPGFIFIEGDLSQAEARVDAVLAEDFEFLEEFDKKPGVHCMTGGWVFECDPWTIKKGTEEYHMAKIVRHAGERNIWPDHLATMLQKSLLFCEQLLEKFHAAQPKIRRTFHFEIKEFVRRNRFLISPQGRRRDFFGKLDWHLYNEAISQIPQATVSDQMKFSMPILNETLDRNQYRWIYEGHDALMAEVKPDYRETFCKEFTKVVERPIDFRGCSLSRDFDLKIPCELEWSDTNWLGMVPV